MVRRKRGYLIPFIGVALVVLLWETAYATTGDVFMKQISETVSRVKTGETPDVRRKAAEHLAELTQSKDSKKIDDETIDNITSLLDTNEDSVRYWVARCLGNLGPRAKRAAPKLQALLAEVDCLPGSKTSASGIRFALAKMGITPVLPNCGATNK